MKRAIVIVPRLRNAGSLARLRGRHDPLAKLIPPHLTLVFPFDNNMSNAQLETLVQRAIRGIRPFPIVLGGVTGHEGEYFFLNVRKGNDEIVDLHHRLYQSGLARHLSPAHTFVPHLTVGRAANRKDFEKSLPAMARFKGHYTATVNELAIYEIGTAQSPRGLVTAIKL